MQQFPKSFRPESLAMSLGYEPEWSEGAVKCPIFQTSTFAFRTAEEGKDFFEVALGKRESHAGEKLGLIYSRLNNPDLEILEERLCLWDKAEASAVFESGMAAISTAVMALVKPGDVLVHSEPVYGGTDHFFKHILTNWGVECVGFMPSDTFEQMDAKLAPILAKKPLGAVYLETPANPTNQIIDLAAYVKIAKKYSRPDRKALVMVDNTFLGPLFQHPLELGADLVLYSATKYIGGHSDLIAGAVLGSKESIQAVKVMRTYFGSMASPWTGWMLMRSLETLSIRMTRQAQTAQIIAQKLNEHPKVEKVYYPGLLTPPDPQYALYKAQCKGPGAMISFDVKGSEKDAFRVLNQLKLVKLAVSLGGTESLAEHPKTMTHSGVDEALKASLGISDQMIRLSVGVEHPEDLWWDLEQALA